MAAARLRWGILGTARINRALIPPLQGAARHVLRAVASREKAHAVAYAREWDIEVAHGGYQALIEDPDIDAIYNPLPNALHAEWTIRAARAGKHVLCEKPIAVSVSEVDAIEKAAREAGVVVTEAFMYRHHPQTLQLKALVDGGAIGDLVLVRGSFTFSLTRTIDVRLEAALGGGSLWDVGCYPVSMARYLIGREPSRAFGWQREAASGIDDLFAGTLQFDRVLAQFDSGFCAPFRTHLEVVGTDGAIAVPMPFKPGLEERLLITRGGDTQTMPVAGQPLYVGEIEDFADAVLLGRAPRVSLADSRGNTATLVALYESARRGGLPVDLE
jgi:xylose dehydrogenase (NAD/NADP)